MHRKHIVPLGAWDTHMHVFNPERFPYIASRSYTPASASMADYENTVTSFTSIVVVQASVQGDSSLPLLETLGHCKTMPHLKVRGIAVLNLNVTTDAELDELHRCGVRGLRVHEMAWGYGEEKSTGQLSAVITSIATRVFRLGWVIQIFCPLHTWAAMDSLLRSLDPSARIVADHIGSTFPGDEHTAEFDVFLNLIKDKKVFVKLSAFERLYHEHPRRMGSLETIVKNIVAVGPDQIIFGSDWPHTQLGLSRIGKSKEQRLNDIEGFRDVDDGGHIEKLREWIPDEETWQKLFVHNPTRLFE